MPQNSFDDKSILVRLMLTQMYVTMWHHLASCWCTGITTVLYWATDILCQIYITAYTGKIFEINIFFYEKPIPKTYSVSYKGYSL